ncbi:hypothetical protein [Aeromicrobium sp. 179-A 4D2 NHS]|uniref:hypothetical protein n=1 Tax=Aeromicrobium sp. 179-A 4D2 NHS TaxID=3142375 RepID=UPI00399FD0E5
MKTSTMMKVEAFREVERVSLLLKRKQEALDGMVVADGDMAEYVAATDEISAEFEEKAITAGVR